MTGKFAAGFIVISAIVAGVAIYWLQVYAFYEEVAFTPGQVDALLMALPDGWFEIRQRGDHGLSDPLPIAPPQA